MIPKSIWIFCDKHADINVQKIHLGQNFLCPMCLSLLNQNNVAATDCDGQWNVMAVYVQQGQFDYLQQEYRHYELCNIEEPTRCNNNLLIYKISSTCFRQSFAHLQERKTEIFTAYGILLLW